MQGWDLSGLSDEALVSQLDELVAVERRVSAAIVAHLCEVERRRLHLDSGYASLYTYCVERLGLSEEVAYKRMQAARAAAKEPRTLALLATGELSLTALTKIAPHLGRAPELLDAARGKSVRDVKRLVAELDPDPVANPAKLEPVAGGRVRLEVVLDDEVAALLEEARGLDRHLDASGDIASLLGRALSGYVKKRRKQRYAETDKPRSASATNTQRIPAAIKRAAADRAGHQCTFVGPSGHRCSETSFLEFDHHQPRALGGSHNTVRVLCRAHNQRHAEQVFGRAHMDRHRNPANDVCRKATLGLTTLGFSKPEAAQAVSVALSRLESPALETLLRYSLRALAPASA